MVAVGAAGIRVRGIPFVMLEQHTTVQTEHGIRHLLFASLSDVKSHGSRLAPQQDGKKHEGREQSCHPANLKIMSGSMMSYWPDSTSVQAAVSAQLCLIEKGRRGIEAATIRPAFRIIPSYRKSAFPALTREPQRPMTGHFLLATMTGNKSAISQQPDS